MLTYAAKLIPLAGFAAISLVLVALTTPYTVERSGIGISHEHSDPLDAADLLIQRNLGLSTRIRARVTVVCEVIEFCRVSATLPSNRILSIDFSGLEGGVQRRMLEKCAPGPCSLLLSGSIVDDEIYVWSVTVDNGALRRSASPKVEQRLMN